MNVGINGSPLTLDDRALQLFGMFRTLRTVHIAQALSLSYSATLALLFALEEAGRLQVHAGRWSCQECR